MRPALNERKLPHGTSEAPHRRADMVYVPLKIGPGATGKSVVLFSQIVQECIVFNRNGVSFERKAEALSYCKETKMEGSDREFGVVS